MWGLRWHCAARTMSFCITCFFGWSMIAMSPLEMWTGLDTSKRSSRHGLPNPLPHMWCHSHAISKGRFSSMYLCSWKSICEPGEYWPSANIIAQCDWQSWFSWWWKVGMHAWWQLDWGVYRFPQSPTCFTIPAHWCLSLLVVVKWRMLGKCNEPVMPKAIGLWWLGRIDTKQWHWKNLRTATRYTKIGPRSHFQCLERSISLGGAASCANWKQRSWETDQSCQIVYWMKRRLLLCFAKCLRGWWSCRRDMSTNTNYSSSGRLMRTKTLWFQKWKLIESLA